MQHISYRPNVETLVLCDRYWNIKVIYMYKYFCAHYYL